MKHLLILLLFFIPFWVSAQTLSTFSGQVSDNKNGEFIENVSLWVESIQLGTLTDINGDFILHLPTGKYNVAFSSPGYYSKTIEVLLAENYQLTIKLDREKKDSRKKISTAQSRKIQNIKIDYSSKKVLSENINANKSSDVLPVLE
ncbi:MAG TPA: carboxypeptidase-like regulatory domain-containing protein [Prolixibacteraceae bacterium]|nr:carboxypeptidase-like regulatory domain-containing protein [Prolixibacteraceae bacterium]